MPHHSSSDRMTVPLSPPNVEHNTTSAPRLAAKRATQTPCPPGWKWISSPPLPASTVTVSNGDGARTMTRGERVPGASVIGALLASARGPLSATGPKEGQNVLAGHGAGQTATSSVVPFA